MSLKASSVVSLALAAIGIFVARISAQAQSTVTDDPVGFVSTTCLSNADTWLSLPLTRPAVFSGSVASVSGSTLVVSCTPGWTANQFVYAQGTQSNTYYVHVGVATSGSYAREGAIYTVVANDETSLTLNLNGDAAGFAAIPTTAYVSVIPYWTLNTLFPATSVGISFTATTNTHLIKTQILLPDNTTNGINLAPNLLYFYYSNGTNTGWRQFGDALTTDHGADILLPNGYVIVRNYNSAPTLPVTITGAVTTKKVIIGLATNANGPQDNAVGLQRPLDFPLGAIGLSPSDGSFVQTVSTRHIQDQLFLYDFSTGGINRSPTAMYYYLASGTNAGWRLFGDSQSTPHDSDVVPAGVGFTIRKATGSGATTVWTNAPNY